MPKRSQRDILVAIAGKAVERGLTPTLLDDQGAVRIDYDEGISLKDDSLHKQSIRSLVKRLDKDEGGGVWKPEILTLGDADNPEGIMVRVLALGVAKVMEGVSDVDLYLDRLESIVERLEIVVSKQETHETMRRRPL